MYIADTVHYVETVNDEPVCRAAIVTAHGADEDHLTLSVIVGAQSYLASEIGYNGTPTGGSWHKGGGVDCQN